MSTEAKLRRTATGVVTSAKMDKSATVLIERKVRHPIYGKLINKSNKMHFHDEQNVCKEGDTVVIEECRPMSKTESWTLVKVVEKV